MSIRGKLDRLVRRYGYEKPQLPESIVRRRKLFAAYSVDVVLDVGANTGQYGQELRSQVQFAGRIVSFEPISSAFQVLSANAAQDRNWQVFNVGLGDVIEQRNINIAANSWSSSLLDMLPKHESAAPESKYASKESIEVKTLDSMFDQICATGDSVYLKIDTQGYERNVLKGAEHSLDCIATVQLELSLVSLYRGDALFDEMCRVMKDKGYTMVAIEPGFGDPETGQMLQCDGIFHRYE
jgi:FkbM family methyltransferase